MVASLIATTVELQQINNNEERTHVSGHVTTRVVTICKETVGVVSELFVNHRLIVVHIWGWLGVVWVQVRSVVAVL